MSNWIKLDGTTLPYFFIGTLGAAIDSSLVTTPYTLSLPPDTGLLNQVLATDGTGILSWQDSVVVGGNDTEIQFNDNGVLAGIPELTIDKLTGSVTSAGDLNSKGLYVSDAAGTNRTLALQTSTIGGKLNRWLILADNSPETGADAGSNFDLKRVADDGTTSASVFTIDRKTGIVDFKFIPTVAGVPIMGGEFPPPATLPAEPDASYYAYDIDNEYIIEITDVYGVNNAITTITYNEDGLVETVEIAYLGTTRLETYSYDDSGNIISMVATTL